VTIHGLEPNTLHNYQVSRDGSGLWLPATPVVFVTAPEANTFFRVAVYGDSRSYPEDHTRVIQSTIDDDPSIVLHTGDIVYYGKNYAGWGPQFFEPAAALIVDTPLFPSPGNHEFLSEGEPDHLWYYDLFSLPGNEKWYAFTYGCARFIALDTNADFTTGTSQHNWLIDELASADYNTAKWHFVFTHYPFYTSGPHPSNERPVLALVEKFEEFDVDMVFSGHNHNYERSLKDGVNYIVTGGGGAELRGFTLDNPYSQVRKNTHHHITLDVSCSGTEQVKMTAWDDDQNGNQFDQVVLHRDVQIAEGTALALRSDASVAGDWINEGAFLHGFHRIDLVGNQQHTIGGSVPTVFYDLTVNRGARVVIPVANTPLIEGTLENNGVLQQTAEVGPDKTVEFLQIDGDKYRGLRITTDAGNSLGSTTARVASSEFCPVAPGLPGDPVKRCYEVLPTAITNNTAAIRLYYRPDEAGDGMPHVNDPDSLAIYRLSGGSWHLVHGAYTRGADGGAYDWVQVSGVHEYGWFMLANAYPLHLPAIFRDGQGTH
jgi:hypothetical protein